jgi:hypothetical protein
VDIYSSTLKLTLKPSKIDLIVDDLRLRMEHFVVQAVIFFKDLSLNELMKIGDLNDKKRAQ